MLVTDHGVIIRFGIETVSTTGRSAVGVHLIKMDKGTKVATMAKVDKDDDSEDEAAETQSTATSEESTPSEN